MWTFIILKPVSTILTNPFFFFFNTNITNIGTRNILRFDLRAKIKHCYANTTIMILLEDLRIKVLQN